MRKARVFALKLLGVDLVLLAVTGVALYFTYRPAASQAWDDIATLSGDVRVSHVLREVHRFAGHGALAIVIVIALLFLLRAGGQRLPVFAGAVVLIGAAASFTGFLLPWDQLALWAVTVGTNMDGYGALFGDQVKFVIIDGVEISRGTLIRWLLVHTLVLGPGLAALTYIGWRRVSKPDGVT